MASFIVSCVLGLFVISTALARTSSPASESLEFEVAGGHRLKRYVSGAIIRLADNYAKDVTSSKDFGKGESGLGHKRAEFIGSIAMPGEEESPRGGAVAAAGGSSPPTSLVPSPHPPEPTTVEAEKVTKKPVDKFPKKAVEEEKTPEKTATVSPKVEESEDSGSYPKEITNNTLKRHNITEKQQDHHTYYTSEFLTGEAIARHYWVDLENEKGVTIHEMLSQSHRRAATVRLSFDFPFYGHSVRNMTVATGGFLYTGDYIHSWLAATQYIAPLMANFDTSMSNDSFVKYRDNGTAFTVEWSSVSLQDLKSAGKFSFQVTLHHNGDIVFVYKTIPMQVENIADNLHPVKVGLSDAYIIDKTVFYIRKKTIYEYHRVSFNRDDIKNWTVIYMRALPTCVNLKDCNSCVNHNTSFSCKWCGAIGRCSSGYDRFLQEWSHNQCSDTAVTESQYCTASYQRDLSHSPSVEAHSKVEESRETRLGHSGMLGVFLVICVLSCLGLWVFHAYRNPHTRFGQILIKYRPSQWRLRRGEARYTAASTIHM